METAPRPRVVIVGCGFGGLFAARALRHEPLDILLIDRNNYHLFQPLLYQVASAALAPADIAQPIRLILRRQHNALVMLAEVSGVDLARRCIHTGGRPVPYDYLILAPGAVDNYFGRSHWHALAPGMKDVEDATRIRSRMLLSFEIAEFETDPHRQAAHLAFIIIIGGGPTGVELAGAIKELAVDVIPRDFRVADTRKTRVTLIEAGQRLLPGLHPQSSARALKQLRDLGVEVRLGNPVTEVFADGVEAGGERLYSYNVIWAAGVETSRLPQRCMWTSGPGARAAGFHYSGWGSMATIGKSRAVVEMGPLRFGGFVAWFAWITLHVTVLIGFRNRVAVFLSWIYSYLFSRRGSRLITESHPDCIENTRSPALRGGANAAADAAAPRPSAESGSPRN